MNDFVAFAQSMGLIIKRLYPSDHIQRCGTTDKPREKDGAYFWDGRTGWVWHWARSAEAQWYGQCSDDARKTWESTRQATKAQREHSHKAATARAQAMLDAAKTDTHDYLARKGFPATLGYVAADGALLIPMRNCFNDALQGIQSITWDTEARKWTKRMLSGMKARAAVFRLGPKNSPETFLCEGYATGLSVAASLRSVGIRGATIVCFSANNMTLVAGMVRPDAIIVADNDASGAGEQAAKVTGLRYCMSDTVGEDANDLHQRAGLLAVAQKIAQARRETVPCRTTTKT